MTPEERCYKILQDSKYIRIPAEDPAEKIKYFLDSGDGCTWLHPTDAIQEKQFETSFKNYFVQYHDEIFELAKTTESTIDGKSKPFTNGYRGMDDQGFEGVIIKDGSFYRNIEDEIETEETQDLFSHKEDNEDFVICDKCGKEFDVINGGFGFLVEHMKYHKGIDETKETDALFSPKEDSEDVLNCKKCNSEFLVSEGFDLMVQHMKSHKETRN